MKMKSLQEIFAIQIVKIWRIRQQLSEDKNDAQLRAKLLEACAELAEV
jgi:hypothetical protein